MSGISEKKMLNIFRNVVNSTQTGKAVQLEQKVSDVFKKFCSLDTPLVVIQHYLWFKSVVIQF